MENKCQIFHPYIYMDTYIYTFLLNAHGRNRVPIYDTRRGRDSRVGQDLSKAFLGLRLEHKCTKSIHCPETTRFRRLTHLYTTKAPPRSQRVETGVRDEANASQRGRDRIFRAWAGGHVHGNLVTNRPRSVNLLDLSRPLSPPPPSPSSPSSVPVYKLFTPGPVGSHYENNSASRRLLMDSEVATISTRRNNVTLIYLRFNPAGSRCSRL